MLVAPAQVLRRAAQGVLGVALSLIAATQDPSAVLAADMAPLVDSAKVVAQEQRAGLSSSLEELERDYGWKVRVYTGFGGPLATKTDAQSPRQMFGPPDEKTLWLKVDPSSPNILNMVYIGDDVLFKLRRPFLQEVQSRYGNQFFVRENGENAAVLQAVGALTQCLAAPEGCKVSGLERAPGQGAGDLAGSRNGIKVVPGLPSGQYYFTLAFSVAGGVIAGAVSKLEPQGIVRRKWIWLLVFSPLWAPLFINFGLGPVLSRTSDALPVVGNFAGFAVGAALPYLDRLLAPQQQQEGGTQ
ncbi:hypothetical protein MNEG_10535 [Monoraphidium neglectum]|uniref:Uncharacterized protein n=1 Tax=Monoraphidium neglectum TaxID=145388 RepID=A0A0D2JCM3_9CHLO|nr:hypothetical protein MNEG_10535 [Monoraphidium neglectum]KIY97427.1 hypothetical protein MNEG_10535 [Monoraphidium neglectum]|eukprot:XP_013896447.1 hypothetical protein MNEG_10535 [Monoraphidium neglectum]